MVRNGFPHLSVYRMLWVFVATWNRISGHTGGSGRNTYQVTFFYETVMLQFAEYFSFQSRYIH
jgi:hypothetical protein